MNGQAPEANFSDTTSKFRTVYVPDLAFRLDFKEFAVGAKFKLSVSLVRTKFHVTNEFVKVSPQSVT